MISREELDAKLDVMVPETGGSMYLLQIGTAWHRATLFT